MWSNEHWSSRRKTGARLRGNDWLRLTGRFRPITNLIGTRPMNGEPLGLVWALICPTGKSVAVARLSLSSPFLKNISLFEWVETAIEPNCPAPHEGRFAIVTDVGCGMRWTLWRRKTGAAKSGRRSRVVLIS